jgi:hypothetical protein
MALSLAFGGRRRIVVETTNFAHRRRWPRPPAVRRIGSWWSSQLLEREAELAVLEGLIGTARRGCGAVALIEGPPGIGKTGLALAARERAEAAGMEALAARAGEFERDNAWGVVRGPRAVDRRCRKA